MGKRPTPSSPQVDPAEGALTMRTNSDDSAPKKKRTMNGGSKTVNKRKIKEANKKMRKLLNHPYHEGFLSVGGECSAGE